MKKLLLIALAMFLLGSVSNAQSPVTIYAGGLVSIPSSPPDFSDYFKNGFHGMVGVGMKSLPYLQFVMKAEYHQFKLDLKNLTDLSGGTRGVWLFGMDARLVINIPASPIRPFLLGGAGVAKVASTDLVTLAGAVIPPPQALKDATSLDETRFYINVGGGLELKVFAMINLFAQARIVKVSTKRETTEFIPITLGLRFF